MDKPLGKTNGAGRNRGPGKANYFSHLLRTWVCKAASIQKHWNEFEKYTCNFIHQNLEQRSAKQCSAKCTINWPPDNGTQSRFSETDIHDTSAITISGLRGISAGWHQPWCCLGRYPANYHVYNYFEHYSTSLCIFYATWSASKITFGVKVKYLPEIPKCNCSR